MYTVYLLWNWYELPRGSVQESEDAPEQHVLQLSMDYDLVLEKSLLHLLRDGVESMALFAFKVGKPVEIENLIGIFPPSIATCSDAHRKSMDRLFYDVKAWEEINLSRIESIRKG